MFFKFRCVKGIKSNDKVCVVWQVGWI